MWKTVLIVVVVLVVGVLGFAATRPDDFSVQRSVSIQAPPEKIYPMLVDFRQWPAWSPWEKLDPAMKRTLSGAPSGPGAVYAWEGNEQGRRRPDGDQGSGGAVEGHRSSSISCKSFRRATTSPTSRSVPQGEQTEVTWLMRGPAPFVSKLMGVFVSMDKMIGSDFETGLANLKAASEK